MGIESVAVGDAGRIAPPAKPEVDLALLFEVAKLRPAKISLLRRIYEKVMGKSAPPEGIKVSGRIYGNLRKQLVGAELHGRSQDLTSEHSKALNGLLDAVMPVCHSRRQVFDKTQAHLQGRKAESDFLGIVRARSSEDLAGDLKTALRARLGESPKAQKRADLLAPRIHAALVHQLALAQEGRRMLEAERQPVPVPAPAPPPAAVKDPLEEKITAIRTRIGVQIGISNETTAVDLGGRSDHLKEAQAEIVGLRVTHGDLPVLAKLEAELRDAQDILQVFKNKSLDLTAIGAQSQTLAAILSQLNARAYVEARRDIRQICKAVAERSEAEMFQHLGAFILEKRSLALLRDIASGDPAQIDAHFNGAHWDDDAYRLKSVRVPAGDEKALRSLDFQHQYRIAANELNRIMQAKVLKDPKLRSKVPLTAFTALKPDPAFASFLRKNLSGTSGGVMGEVLKFFMGDKARKAGPDVDLLIANWARLSLYDPATGQVDKLALHEFLQKMGLDAADLQRIERYAAQGFRSMAEVTACTDHLRRFADAISSDGMLHTMEMARSTAFRAQEISRVLMQKFSAEDLSAKTSNEINAVMKNGLASVIQLSKHGEVLQGQMQQRADIVKSIQAMQSMERDIATGDLDWLQDPKAVESRKPYINLALEAIGMRPNLQGLPLMGKERGDLALALTKKLEGLKGFSLKNFSHTPDSDGDVLLPQLEGSVGILHALTDLSRKDNAIKLQKEKLVLAQEQRGLIEQALKVAILQEVALTSLEDFTPAKACANILKNLAGFGIDSKSRQEPMVSIVGELTNRLMEDERSITQICDAYERDAAIDSKQLAKAARALVTTNKQQKVQETLHTVQHAVHGLKRGQSIDIRFGAFGSVKVSVPVALGGGVNLETEMRRHHGLTVACDSQGRYAVEIHQGHQVRQGVSLAAIADVLSIGADSSQGVRQGHRFTVDSEADCRTLVNALVTGDSKALELCVASRVERTAQSSRASGASMNAQIDVSLLTLSGQLRAEQGIRVDSRVNTSGTVEIYTRQQLAMATATAELAAGRGSAQAVTGQDLSVARTSHKQFGLLKEGCGVVVSAKVFGDDLRKTLGLVLPSGLRSLAGEYAEKIGAVDEGSEMYVALRLDDDVRIEVNKQIRKAQDLLMKASAESRERRAALMAQAQDLLTQADVMTRDCAHYIPEGIGWLSEDTTEVTSTRGAFDYFASAQSRGIDGFLPFDAAAPMKRGELLIP